MLFIYINRYTNCMLLLSPWWFQSLCSGVRLWSVILPINSSHLAQLVVNIPLHRTRAVVIPQEFSRGLWTVETRFSLKRTLGGPQRSRTEKSSSLPVSANTSWPLTTFTTLHTLIHFYIQMKCIGFQLKFDVFSLEAL